jgi:hypothetical protein
MLRGLYVGPGPLVLPNAWDVASARLVVNAGFPVVGVGPFDGRSRGRLSARARKIWSSDSWTQERSAVTSRTPTTTAVPISSTPASGASAFGPSVTTTNGRDTGIERNVCEPLVVVYEPGL